MDDFELEYAQEIPSFEEMLENQQDIEQFQWENHRHNYYGLSLFNFI